MEKPVYMRIDRWLTSQGVGSRKYVGKLIRSGRVEVNGQAVNQTSLKVSPQDQVKLDGEELSLEQYAYYMMNKPAGVLSATRDKHGSTVLELLPKALIRPGLFPAGRLDKDTEGFIIITNDGDFAHRMLSPKNRVPKTYEARLSGEVEVAELTKAFSEGVVIGQGEETSGAELELVEGGSQPLVRLTIYEGMFHQVKRMFALFGLKVIYLRRIQIGDLVLDDRLELGESRKITKRELEKIC